MEKETKVFIVTVNYEAAKERWKDLMDEELISHALDVWHMNHTSTFPVFETTVEQEERDLEENDR